MVSAFGYYASAKGMVLVPNLSGLTRPNAITAIQNAGLTPVAGSVINTGDSGLDDFIASQTPAAGNLVDYETNVQYNYYDFVAPTYSISPSSTSVNEGSSVTFTVNTTNFGTGTLYWTLEPVSGTINNSDFSSPANAVSAGGSVSISGETGSFIVTLANDLTTEGEESFRARLRTVSTSGTIVATSATITINDTSIIPPFFPPFFPFFPPYFPFFAEPFFPPYFPTFVPTPSCSGTCSAGTSVTDNCNALTGSCTPAGCGAGCTVTCTTYCSSPASSPGQTITATGPCGTYTQSAPFPGARALIRCCSC